MRLVCVKGIGQDHAKFSPVGKWSFVLMSNRLFRSFGLYNVVSLLIASNIHHRSEKFKSKYSTEFVL